MAWNPENLQRYEDEMRAKRIDQERQADAENADHELAKLRSENRRLREELSKRAELD